jgi:hypothetical protein
MKRLIILAFILGGIVACQKETEFKTATFPGFTGAGNQAVWVVYGHVITDIPFVTSYLSKLTPPVRFSFYDSTIMLARQKEVSPYSYKFLVNGEVAVMGKGPANENVWATQPALKWESFEGNLYLYRIENGAKVNIAIGFPDGAGMLMKFKKTYFRDTSADKDRYVQEIFYTMFK